MSLLDRVVSPEIRVLYRRLLWDGARMHWRGYAVAIGLLLVVSVATAAMAWVMKDVINELFVDRRADMIRWIALGVIAIFLVRGLATYGNAVILSRIGNRIVARLQQRLFSHLLRQNAEFYDTHTLGDVMARFNGAAASARAAIDLLIVSVGRDAVSLIGLVAVMVLQNPAMSLIAVVIAPPAVLAVGWLTKQVKTITRASIDANARITTRVREVYQGARVVKAFTLEDHLGDEMNREIQEVRELANQTVRYSTLTVPMMDILGGVAVGSVIAFAGWQIASGAEDPGTFFSFLTALLLAYEPARRLARFQVQLQALMVGVELMYGFLDRPATEVDLDAKQAGPMGTGAVRLTDVHFAYEARPALDGLTLEAEQGQVTALVGASGAGKSTVFEMLTRFRIPDRGDIEFCGRPIESLGLADLRRNTAVVGQQTFLFAGTIRENIRFGRLDATDAEVEEAAKAANAHAFIMDRPRGYDSRINDDGGLSGGERQRIAIARAMLRDAPVLLLDEATSALDAESEARVKEALGRLMQNRTTLVIAHRLATVREASMIHVMDAGKVVESGSHDALLARNGVYANLYRLQFGKDGPVAEKQVQPKN
ncbi:MAG: ABC transporter ATP-binding protein [Pseudomonadota bacterium]